MWVAPGHVDVAGLAADLSVSGDVQAFEARTVAPTRAGQMVGEAWDLDAIAAGYTGFLERWDDPTPLPQLPDDLARSLWLVTEWRQLVLEDPMLPGELLPTDWPAAAARSRFDDWYARYEPSATDLFDAALDALTASATAS